MGLELPVMALDVEKCGQLLNSKLTDVIFSLKEGLDRHFYEDSLIDTQPLKKRFIVTVTNMSQISSYEI